MKGLEKGKDKVKKICDVLRRETIEPAKLEADEILEIARLKADEIVEQAKKESQQLLAHARAQIEKERAILQASLAQACKQSVEVLKQNIEEKLFDHELGRALAKPLQDPALLAKLISTIVTALEKEGIGADLSVYIPAAAPAREINELLGRHILDKLKEKSILVGPFAGGVEVKLHKENITIDISDVAVKELVANYIRKDFREMIFGSSKNQPKS
jgi:V/A-type H+/Na+-transporting ATPase subunit E